MALLVFSLVLLLFVVRRYYLRWSRPDEYADIPIKVYTHYDGFVSKRIPYYNALSEEGKRRFIRRCTEVRRSLVFQGREGFSITPEVEILISACITQLTFGFGRSGIRNIDGVAVFPDVFYSRLAGNWVKGLAMNNGVVFLSWPDFLKGYENSTDTYNLGLHEFTHMLKLQVEDNMKADQRMITYFEEWNSRAEVVFSNLRNGREDFFRAYAQTNMSEFFSVCVENFFEIPAEMERELPDLFYHLCYLLHQNPLNSADDYRFDREDVQEVVYSKKVSLPVYAFEHPAHEFQFWWVFRVFAGLFVFIDFLLFNIHESASQQFVLAGAGLVVATYLTIRLIYYKNIQMALNHLYLRHLFIDLLPLFVFALYLINAFV